MTGETSKTHQESREVKKQENKGGEINSGEGGFRFTRGPELKICLTSRIGSGERYKRMKKGVVENKQEKA